MIPFPNIDPILLRLGPLQIRWYGLMYLFAFVSTYFLVRYQVRKKNLQELEFHFDNLLTALIIGVVLGGRLGYVVFYNPAYYLRHPLEVLATWQGGMSFHGGLLGVTVASIYYIRKHKLDFWQTADPIVATVPIGLGFGRLGNFINGELFGRVTDVPWAMVFPTGGPRPRHPSQLYEFFLEGVVLFCLLWFLKDRKIPAGAIVGFFLFFYGVSRCFVELFREPDAQLGFFFSRFTMGQFLSVAMLAAGLAVLFFRYREARR